MEPRPSSFDGWTISCNSSSRHLAALNLTIVFAPPAEGEPLPTVHSRHVAVAPADIVGSQYTGSCTPKT